MPLSVLLLAPSALAAVRTVEADGSGQYTSIQAAISASSDGDEIRVGPGEWSENLDFGSRTITLTSTDGADATTLTSPGPSPVVTIWGGAPVLDGFTLTNPYGRAVLVYGGYPTLSTVTVQDSGASGAPGGGLYVAAGTTTISGSTFSGNEASYGAAIYVVSAIDVTDSTFSENSAEYNGGAVEVAEAASASFTDSTFTGNIQGSTGTLYTYGGAVNSEKGATLTFERVDFTGNGNTAYATQVTYGGGVFLGESVVATVTDCTFSENVGYYGGAFFQHYYGDLTITGSEFTGDYAYYAASVYSQYTSRLAISDTTFNTETTYYYGAALYLYSITTLTLENVDFTENLATYGYGGALMAYYVTTLSMTDTAFTENVSYYDGGAIYLYSVADLVGTDVSFVDNVSTYGNGGAAIAQYITAAGFDGATMTGNEAYYAGGAFYWYGGLTLSDAVVTDNFAELRSGGGLYLVGYGVPFVLDHVDISENIAGGDGGGVALLTAPSLTVTNSRFVGNEAGTMGGALYADAAESRIVDNVVFEAGTADYGGGVYVSGAATPDTWSHVVLAENEARVGGGGVFLETTLTEMTNSLVIGNAASEEASGLYSYVAPLALVNSVVGWNAGSAAVYFWSDDVGTRLQYDAWWENASGDLAGAAPTLDDTHVAADPLFTDWSSNGDDTDDSFVLGTESELIDAGDPTISDPDGSVSDIGLLGGIIDVADADGDGVAGWQDCDDADPDVHPGASDTPYDDEDTDCGGDSDWDQDGDGEDAAEGGGDDCDDTDASVILCDTGETGDTGIVTGDDTALPTDDTGAGPTPEPEPGCGCASGGGGAGWLLPLLLVGWRARRRTTALRNGAILAR